MTIYFDKNKKPYGYLIENAIANVDDETWLKYDKTDKWDIIDGKFTDITDTDYYKKKLRLAEIETELTKADADYQTVLDTPVKYTNNYTYKPSYVDSYALLIASGVSPLTIWDATELNSVSMTTAELTALSVFLKDIAEPAFQTRKITRKALLTEKATLTAV